MEGRCYSLKLGKLRCCYTTKSMGSFTFARAQFDTVLANYRRLEEETGIAPDSIARAHLANGVKVAKVTKEDMGRGVTRDPGPLMKVDALHTNIPRLYLGLCTADCFALTLHDRVKRALGIAHCGWRGVVGRLDQKLLEAMRGDYGTNPKDVVAVIGPGIRVCCYQQQDDGLRTAFAEYQDLKLIEEHDDGEYSIDVALALRHNLAQLGIKEVVDTGLCTGCNPEFYSARKEGFTTGRMLNLAAMIGN